MTPSALCVVVIAATSTACGGPELRGAYPELPEFSAGALPASRFFATDCRDGRGQAAEAPAVEWSSFRDTSGRELWLEWRKGYETVRIFNSFADGADQVWQFISEDGGGTAWLHQLRVARSRASSPRLLVADGFEVQPSGSGFRARPTRTSLVCTLVQAPPHLTTQRTTAAR